MSALATRPYSVQRSRLRAKLHGATPREAAYWFATGQITEHEYRAFGLAFTWCAIRLTHAGGTPNYAEIQAQVAQRDCALALGTQGLRRRRDRALVLWSNFCGVQS